MKYLYVKDRNQRKLYPKNEYKKIIIKWIQKICSKNNKLNFFGKELNYNLKIIYSDRCIISNRGRPISKLYHLSRLELKKVFEHVQILGITKK